jgi:Arc/MetJ family transcription regulator
MATNLALDNDLINQAVKYGKHKTKKEAVNAALKEYVQRHGQIGFLELAGTVEYMDGYDYKKARNFKRRRQ